MFCFVGFCSIALSLLSYIRSRFFSEDHQDRLDVIAFTLLLIGIIFFLGTMGISNTAVLGSSAILLFMGLVYQLLI